MSITFSIARRRDDGSIIRGCPLSEDHRTCRGTCEDPEFYGYCECVVDAIGSCPECSLSLNISNANAAQILDRLGIEFDHCGAFDPADLFGRAAVGNIGRDDSGVAASVIGGNGRVALIECGLPAGYFEDRLGALTRLAQYAIEHGTLVSWG
jgi:hypothetical protein